MLNKDKLFKTVMKEFRAELSSFEDLKIIPTNLYQVIIEPLLTVCCNNYMGGEDILYTIRLESMSFDKTTSKLEVVVGLYIADFADFKFKHYKVMLTFGGTGK